MAPNLHWPDTMFSFDSSTGVLYTCDAFGLHYCDSEPFDTDLKAIEPHFRFYYDCLMKPNARSVLSALKRTKDMDYSTIAVGHGPLLRYNLSELVGRYGAAALTVCFFPVLVWTSPCCELVVSISLPEGCLTLFCIIYHFASSTILAMTDDTSCQPAVKATAATQKATPQEVMPSHLLLQFASTKREASL